MRLLAAFLVSAAFIRTAGGAPAQPAPPAAEPALTPAELARARTLETLAADGRALLDKINAGAANAEEALPQAEKERLVRGIILRYETLLRENPDDLESLLLYGKFLRLVGERELAYKVFLRADKGNPDLAVVKHQLGAHLAENGAFAEALPLLQRAIELAPAEPRYRYDFAEFLAATTTAPALAGIPRETRDRMMLDHFDKAAALKPAEAGYRWRAAEARYDVAKPDAAEALAKWDALDKDAGTPAEKEVISLHRARWLIALKRTAEARKLIAASKSPQLNATRGRLYDDLLRLEPGLTDPFPERNR